MMPLAVVATGNHNFQEIDMSDGFKGSPEYDDWIESGGKDEDYNYYYQKWERRVRNS